MLLPLFWFLHHIPFGQTIGQVKNPLSDQCLHIPSLYWYKWFLWVFLAWKCDTCKWVDWFLLRQYIATQLSIRTNKWSYRKKYSFVVEAFDLSLFNDVHILELFLFFFFFRGEEGQTLKLSPKKKDFELHKGDQTVQDFSGLKTES